MRPLRFRLTIFSLLILCLAATADAQPGGRRLPPATLTIANQEALAAVHQGDQFVIHASVRALADVTELRVEIVPDRNVKIVAGEPLCSFPNVSAGAENSCEVTAELDGSGGKVTVFYGTVLTYGSIGDSQVLQIGGTK